VVCPAAPAREPPPLILPRGRERRPELLSWRRRFREVYDDAARERMVEFIQRASKPCLAFKVLKANRHCATPESVRAALQYAYEQLKPSDVVCVGMWGKYLDQVAQNCQWVREIPGAG